MRPRSTGAIRTEAVLFQRPEQIIEQIQGLFVLVQWIPHPITRVSRRLARRLARFLWRPWRIVGRAMLAAIPSV